MTRLWECIESLLEEIRISRKDFIKMEYEGDTEKWEVEVSLPLQLALKSVKGKVIQNRERDVDFIFESVLETLEIEERGLNDQLVRERLRHEVGLLFPRWQKGEMDKNRLLNDFCQRVLVIFGDHQLFRGQVAFDSSDEAENTSLRFEQLTEELTRRLKGLFDVIAEDKTEIWLEDTTPSDPGHGIAHSALLKVRCWG